MFRLLSPTLLLLLLACGPTESASDASSKPDAGWTPDAGTTPDAGGTPDAAPRPVEILFQATRDGGPTPVERVVYAEPYHVVVENLAPGQSLFVQATMWGYESHADFVAGDDGRLDTARDAPVPGTGTYEGVDPDGLTWSMEKLSNRTEDNYDITYHVWTGGDEPTTRTLVRLPMGHDARLRDVREDGLYGTLLVPPGPPRPVVVVVGGSEGGLDGALFSAAHVETMGYAALALAYFDAQGLPATLTEIPLEYFGRAFAWLRRQTDVDGERILFLGGSRGGELALLVASTFPDDVDAVIAHVGSGLVFGSPASMDRSAWSQGGAPVPFLQLPDDLVPVTENLPRGGTGYRWAPATEAAIQTMPAESVDAVTIAVEAMSGPALIVAGEDDGLWPSCFLSRRAWSRLQSSGHEVTHGDAFHCLPDAGHWFGTPGWPTAESYTSWMEGQTVILGGTPAGNGRASRAYDTLIRAFLRRVAP
jgi:acetyl esterase/lipase